MRARARGVSVQNRAPRRNSEKTPQRAAGSPYSRARPRFSQKAQTRVSYNFSSLPALGKFVFFKSLCAILKNKNEQKWVLRSARTKKLLQPLCCKGYNNFALCTFSQLPRRRRAADRPCRRATSGGRVKIYIDVASEGLHSFLRAGGSEEDIKEGAFYGG